MIREWNLATGPGEKTDWQQYLWQQAKELLGSRLPDKTNISSYITAELKKPEQQQNLQQKMPVINTGIY